MKNKLTFKQEQFAIQYVACNGNGTEAARQAKYKGNDVTLCAVGKENLRKPLILEAIQRIKDKNGLSDENLELKHIQLLNAKRLQVCDVYVQNDNGKFTINKNSNDFIEVDDNNVQLGALKLAYEINGKLKQKIEHSGEIKFSAEEKYARVNRIKELLSV